MYIRLMRSHVWNHACHQVSSVKYERAMEATVWPGGTPAPEADTSKALGAGDSCSLSLDVLNSTLTKHAKRAELECPAGNKPNDSALQTSTVHSVLATAAARGMESVAMPLIGTGLAGWPKPLAAEVCLAEVSSFLRAAPSSLRVSEDDAALPACSCFRFHNLQPLQACRTPPSCSCT